VPKNNYTVTVWDAEMEEYQPLKKLESIDFNRLISHFNMARIKIVLSDGNVIVIDKIGQNVDTYA
jgi:hypothetical protein